MAPLVVIVGETASGKSALAMALAEKFNGEIICADSRTVYKGMDIGTAKPSKQDQAKIKHHLLDVVEPSESFNVSDFKKLAEAVIADISARGKLPIMVGGSGLYVDAVIYDFELMLPVDQNERARLSDMTVEELQAEIARKGLKMPTNERNPRHLTRAIETAGQSSTKKELKKDTVIIGLKVPKEELDKRITKRVNKMFTGGLETEVKVLSEKYGWGSEAMKSIGYREFQDLFNSTINAAEAQNRIIQATIKLAKKQRTWFKRNSSIQWLDDPSKAVDIVTTLLNKRQ